MWMTEGFHRPTCLEPQGLVPGGFWASSSERPSSWPRSSARGSRIRLSPNDVGLELPENAAATAAALVAIILAVGPVSGAHLNPVVTLANRFLGGLGSRVAACYVGRAACWRRRRSCRRQPDVRPADRRAVDQDPQLGRNLARGGGLPRSG